MYKSGFKLSVKKQGSTNVVRMVAQKKGASIPEMYVTVNSKYYPTQVRIKQKRPKKLFGAHNNLQRPNRLFPSSHLKIRT